MPSQLQKKMLLVENCKWIEKKPSTYVNTLSTSGKYNVSM